MKKRMYKVVVFMLVVLVVLVVCLGICVWSFSRYKTVQKVTSTMIAQGEYPFYFQPIVDEIHNLAEQGNHDWWTLSTWCEEEAYSLGSVGDDFTVCGGAYAQKSFTLTYEFQKSKWKTLDGEVTFDLTPYITSQATDEEWLMAACFYQEEKDTMYIILHNFVMWESEESQEAWIAQESGSPQLMFLECSLKKDKQHVTAYEVEPLSRFSWAADCRMVGDTIYISGGPGDSKEIAAIDLETRELRYCVDEYQALQEYASSSFDMEQYYLMLHEAVYEEGDVTVYSAKVGNDGFDGPATAHVFVAMQNGAPIDYMTYYVESQEIEWE